MKQQFSQAIGVLPVIFPTILTMAAALDCYLSYRVSGFVLKRIGGTSFLRCLLFPLEIPEERLRCASRLGASLGFRIPGRGMEHGHAHRHQCPDARELPVPLPGTLPLLVFPRGRGQSPQGAGRFLRTVAIIVAVLVPMLSTATVMVGIADMWLDFRTRFRRNDER